MSIAVKKHKVAIIYSFIPQYRWRFYEVFKDELNQMGIELIMIRNTNRFE